MYRLAIALAALLIAACSTPSARAPDSQERGRQLAATHCSSCHATGLAGDSPARGAAFSRVVAQLPG